VLLQAQKGCVSNPGSDKTKKVSIGKYVGKLEEHSYRKQKNTFKIWKRVTRRGEEENLTRAHLRLCWGKEKEKQRGLYVTSKGT
jgi:hypothetical protein